MTATRRGSERRGGLSASLLRLLAATLLVSGLVLAARDFRFLALGATATGTIQSRIVRPTDAGIARAVFVEFRDRSGVTRIARIDVLKSVYEALAPMTTREIVYLPGEPERARFAGDTGLGIPALLVSLAALFAVVSSAGARSGVAPPRPGGDGGNA